MKKWIIGLVCGVVGVTAAWGQVATLPISESYTATQDWTALTGWSGVGMGTYADGRAQFNANNDSLTVNFDSAPGTLTFDIKGNTATTGTEPMQFDAEESADGSNWSPIVSIDHTQINASTFTTFGPYTLNNASRYVRWTYVNKYGFNVGLNNVYITTGGPAEFSVGVNKTDGFTVEQGTQDAIVATAQNGAEPYGYDWATDMTVGDYDASGDTFTILATAAVGEYYATVTATDDESETADKTVNFSVIAPPDYYVITITPPSNGSVTTTPAEEAAENSTVTINTTPADGYAVGTITVTAADESNVTVTGNTFTMPSQDVTVAVTFVEATGGLIISQYVETEAGSVPKGIEIWNASGSDITFDAGANLLEVLVGANGGVPALSGGIAVDSGTLTAGDVLVIGTDDMTPDVAKTFQFNGDDAIVLQLGGVVQDVIGTVGSDPGAAWSGGGVSTANQNIQLKEGITTGDTDGWTDPSDRFETVSTTPSTDLTGFGVPPGGSEAFSVSFNKTDGFDIEEGAGDAITAIAANGVEPYSYEWISTLTGTHYEAIDDVFTILDTAPVGDYTATVTVTDDTSDEAVNTISFSVVAPAVKYGITINPAINGNPATVPADEAEEGQTVTIVPNPDGGYAVDTITVVGADETPIEVTGTTFTMPAQAVTVTVTFAELPPVVAEGIVDFRFNEEPYLQVTAKDANLTVSDMALTAGTIETAITTGTYFPDPPYIEESAGWTADNQAAAKAFIFTITPGEGASVTINGISFNAYATSAGPSAFGFDIGDGTATYEVDAPSASLVAVSQAVAGVVAQTGPIAVKIQGWLNGSRTSSGGGVFRLDDVVIHGSVSTGPLEFSVSFNKTDGFEIEEGAGDAITAIAANGVEPYSYEWISTLTGTHYEAIDDVFTILDTAPIGDYTATVTVTDSSEPAQVISNTINFSIVAPPTKYAITIVTNSPANGTVTTTPATEAAEGVNVTVNAVPGDGFAVESIVVNGGAVAVTGTTFTMPAEPVTVTVNFMVYVAPDVLIDFEDYTSITYALHDYTTAGVTFSMTNILAGGTEGSDRFNDTKSARFHHNRTAGNAAVMSQTVPFAEAITGISFWFADYGTDSGGAFKVQVCDDGTNWQDVGEALYDPAGTTLEMAEINSIPPGMTYVQFIGVGEAAKRFNIDDIGLYFGEPVFGVSLNKSNGFEVQEGQSDAIVATAANGTPDYAYSWETTLPSGYSTNGNVFTILATAPTGSYSATVTATDSSEPAQEAQRTVTFSVVGLPPGQPAVVFSGSLTGTVGVRLELTLGVTNTTLIEFQSVSLKDPLGVDIWDWDYSNFPPDFAFTPDQAGNWTLTAVANTTSGILTNGVTLTISEGGGDEPPPIPAITFVAGTGFSFEVPAGHTVARVEGADAAVAGEAFTWTLLSSPTDYEVVGTQVTIKSAPQDRRLIRVVFNVTP